MSVRKITVNNNRLYRLTLGAEQNTGDLTAGAFYKIVAKATSGSIIPAQLNIGNVFYTPDGGTLASGDIVIPLTQEEVLFASSWTCDEEREAQTAQPWQAEVTEQYISGIATGEGSFSGAVDYNSSLYKELQGQVNRTQVVGATLAGSTVREPSEDPIHLLLAIGEHNAKVDDTIIYKYVPIGVKSVAVPQEGKELAAMTVSFVVMGQHAPNNIEVTKQS